MNLSRFYDMSIGIRLSLRSTCPILIDDHDILLKDLSKSISEVTVEDNFPPLLVDHIRKVLTHGIRSRESPDETDILLLLYLSSSQAQFASDKALITHLLHHDILAPTLKQFIENDTLIKKLYFPTALLRNPLAILTFMTKLLVLSETITELKQSYLQSSKTQSDNNLNRVSNCFNEDLHLPHPKPSKLPSTNVIIDPDFDTIIADEETQQVLSVFSAVVPSITTSNTDHQVGKIKPSMQNNHALVQNINSSLLSNTDKKLPIHNNNNPEIKLVPPARAPRTKPMLTLTPPVAQAPNVIMSTPTDLRKVMTIASFYSPSSSSLNEDGSKMDSQHSFYGHQSSSERNINFLKHHHSSFQMPSGVQHFFNVTSGSESPIPLLGDDSLGDSIGNENNSASNTKNNNNNNKNNSISSIQTDKDPSATSKSPVFNSKPHSQFPLLQSAYQWASGIVSPNVHVEISSPSPQKIEKVKENEFYNCGDEENASEKTISVARRVATIERQQQERDEREKAKRSKREDSLRLVYQQQQHASQQSNSRESISSSSESSNHRNKKDTEDEEETHTQTQPDSKSTLTSPFASFETKDAAVAVHLQNESVSPKNSSKTNNNETSSISPRKQQKNQVKKQIHQEPPSLLARKGAFTSLSKLFFG